jgi:hypothetical protein
MSKRYERHNLTVLFVTKWEYSGRAQHDITRGGNITFTALSRRRWLDPRVSRLEG